jgi:GT2 family glycosyltransferase
LNSNSSRALNPTADRIDDAPQVSVIIVNWNGARVLDRCLTAVFHQTFTRYEVIVIDNHSTDGSADDLESKFRSRALLVERLPKNLGFPVANNIGARLARGKWLALLNNDAFPALDWLANLMGAAAQHRAFTFFASRMIQSEDNSRLDGAGDVYHISGLAWRRHYGQCGVNLAHEVEEVFSPCAGAALYSRDAFLQSGGFDEDFFSYHEDVDLGFRLLLQGQRCLYVPTAVVEHVGSASHGKRSDFAIYHGHRNLVWTYWKNMPTPLFWRYLPAHLAANLFYLAYYSLRGQWRAIWRAKVDALRGLPKMLRKRRDIQRNRTASAAEISRMIEHDWNAPLRGFLARQ